MKEFKTTIKLLLATGILAASLQPAFAHFNNMGVGARGCGMANAFTGIADDVYTIYYNPAGLVRINGKELALEVEEKVYDWLS